MLFDPEVLADSRVELEVSLSAQSVEGKDCTLPRPDAVAILASDSVTHAWIPKRIQGSCYIVGARSKDHYAICAASAEPKHIHGTAVTWAVRASRLQLHNRGKLESHWQIDHAAHRKAMTRVIWNRTQRILGKIIKVIHRAIAEGGGPTVVCQRP